MSVWSPKQRMVGCGASGPSRYEVATPRNPTALSSRGGYVSFDPLASTRTCALHRPRESTVRRYKRPVLGF
eukprot:1192663-Prorocentrum_minimum.AAC.1